MTKAEKRIVYFAVFLVAFAFLAHGLTQTTATAEYSEPATSTAAETTATHWNTINEENTREAWEILREEFSEVATAAILGNLHYESRMYSYRIENFSPEESKNISDWYIQDKERFINSSYGYGLAQWTGYNNLKRLWEWCEDNGYEVDSIEGQIRFLISDYPYMKAMSCKRMEYYDVDDIVTATEDFRQSYEKSVMTPSSQYCRAKLAKTIYASYCEDVYTISEAAQAPMDFEIYEKVKKLNERIMKDESENGIYTSDNGKA